MLAWYEIVCWKRRELKLSCKKRGGGWETLSSVKAIPLLKLEGASSRMGQLLHWCSTSRSGGGTCNH